MLISDNGVVLHASWDFLTVNNTLLIETKHESIMFHPLMIDNLLFALQQSGTDRYMMMVDSENASQFKDISIDSLNQYLVEKEEARKQYEERKIEEEKRRMEEERQRIEEDRRRMEAERRERELQEERNRIEAEYDKQIERIKKGVKTKTTWLVILLIVDCILYASLFFNGNFECILYTLYIEEYLARWIFGMLFILILFLCIFGIVHIRLKANKKINKIKETEFDETGQF